MSDAKIGLKGAPSLLSSGRLQSGL